MATLPLFKSDDQSLTLLQTAWKAILTPLIRNQLNVGILLPNVALTTGANVVNHKLQQPLVGWLVVRKRANAAIYDTQDTNPIPQLTLQLVSDAPTTVDLYVF